MTATDHGPDDHPAHGPADLPAGVPDDLEVRLPHATLSTSEPSFFEFRSRGWTNGGFVLMRRGGWLAYLNRCAHLPLTLDLGDGDLLDEQGDHFICHNHGAIFEVDSGLCTWGPCKSHFLQALPVRVDGDSVVVDVSGVDRDRSIHPDFDDDDL